MRLVNLTVDPNTSTLNRSSLSNSFFLFVLFFGLTSRKNFPKGSVPDIQAPIRYNLWSSSFRSFREINNILQFFDSVQGEWAALVMVNLFFKSPAAGISYPQSCCSCPHDRIPNSTPGSSSQVAHVFICPGQFTCFYLISTICHLAEIHLYSTGGSFNKGEVQCSSCLFPIDWFHYPAVSPTSPYRGLS